jgi:hypothetical protein
VIVIVMNDSYQVDGRDKTTPEKQPLTLFDRMIDGIASVMITLHYERVHLRVGAPVWQPRT